MGPAFKCFGRRFRDCHRCDKFDCNEFCNESCFDEFDSDEFDSDKFAGSWVWKMRGRTSAGAFAGL